MKILTSHVENAVVDYAGIKATSAEALEDYLDMLAQVERSEFTSWSEADQLAFLLNLYNAATLQLIVEHYPVSSILAIPQRWDRPFISLFSERVTLNHIEHEIIRKEYPDPRAHYGLVCAAQGCPPLMTEPYQGARLEEQLDSQGRVFMANPLKNYVDPGTGTVHLSPIYKWFQVDFEQGQSLLEFVTPFFPEAVQAGIPADAEIAFTYYDWRLNQPGVQPLPRPPAGFQIPVLNFFQYSAFLLGTGPKLLFILVVALSAIFLRSGIVAGLLAGFLFGTSIGLLLFLAGCALLGTTTFLLGRRPIWKPLDQWLQKRSSEPALQALDWRSLTRTQVAQYQHFPFLNYRLGKATAARPIPVFVATVLGMLPYAFALGAIGMILRSLAFSMIGFGSSLLGWVLDLLFVAAVLWIVRIVIQRARSVVPAQST